MQIQTNSYGKYPQATGYPKKNSPSFKQINPEHMFIRSYGYKKDMKWAKHVVGIIGQAKIEVANSAPFENVLNFVANKYGEYFKHIIAKFGELRESNVVQTTMIREDGQYGLYLRDLKNLAVKEGETRYLLTKNGRLPIGKEHVRYYLPEGSDQPISLNRVLCLRNIPMAGETVMIESPRAKSVPRVISEVSKIYHQILENKNELTAENIKVITKDIAKIHWFLSQVRPYGRGSAGIADTIAKTMFEAKGIQVSSYKKNIDPNLEAFVMPLDKYTEAFEGFFEKHLIPINETSQKNEPKNNWFKKIFIGG